MSDPNSPLRFPARPSLQDRAGDPSLDVRLTKGERTRRYHIRLNGRTELWFCQVWFGEQTQHRGVQCDVITAQRTFAEYHREIGELLVDGWTVAAGRYRDTLTAQESTS